MASDTLVPFVTTYVTNEQSIITDPVLYYPALIDWRSGEATVSFLSPAGLLLLSNAGRTRDT